MMNQKKKKQLVEKNNDRSTYNVWKRYDDFIRSIHNPGELIKKPTGRELTWKYLTKLAVVFAGAFFTTLTFYFLIDPNGLYNSGLNGFLQSIAKLIVGHNNIGWGYYYFVYYGLGLLTNLSFILFLRFFFKAKLEIISTSIFYVFSQIIWTQIFNLANLREHIFNRLNPTSWQGLSSQSQLSFTLPYYIVIAIVAAIIHTYGYSLIFRAQATPGGLEIFTSHFSSQKKNKFSISTFTKMFGFAIIFLVTLINFFYIEDNPKMKKSSLHRGIQEIRDKNDEMKSKDSKELLDIWKSDMEKINSLKDKEEKEAIVKIFEIRKKNQPLTELFKNKTGGEVNLENYPQEIDYYPLSEEEKISKLSEEIEKTNSKISNLSKREELTEKLRRKSNLEKRVKTLTKEREKNSLYRYLGYISNNERLWATMVYIFLSSFLISQIFPRDKIVLLRLHALNEENRNRGLKLLKNFSPTYHAVYHQRNEEETIYIVNCYLSKWNYYLLIPYLKQVGKTYINETN